VASDKIKNPVMDPAQPAFGQQLVRPGGKGAVGKKEQFGSGAKFF